MKGRDRFGESRRKGEDNIKMNLRGIGYGLDSSGSVIVHWLSVVKTVMVHRVPLKGWKFLHQQSD